MRIYKNNHACFIKKPSAKPKPHEAIRKSSRILDSKKAADKREQTSKRRRPEMFCAYVGNIHPLTSIAALTDLFEQCEGLTEIRLRIGHGLAVPHATPDTLIDDLDVQFATVYVSEWRGLVQAMKMNGSILGGRRLVVGLTSAVLPEMDRIIYEHYHGAGAVRHQQQGGRPLRPEPTEIIIEPPRPRGALACTEEFLIRLPITLM